MSMPVLGASAGPPSKRAVGPLDKRRRVTRCQPCAVRRIKCQGGIPCEYCTRVRKNCLPQRPQQWRLAATFVALAGKIPQRVGLNLDERMLDSFAAFIRRTEFTQEFAAIHSSIAPLLHRSPMLRHISIAIGALDASRKGSFRSQAMERPHEQTAFTHYHKALTALRCSIMGKDAPQRDANLLGIFLFGIFELLSEPSGDSWAKHMLYGTSLVMEPSVCGRPESFHQALGHAFRMLEATRAIMYGEDTVLPIDDSIELERGLLPQSKEDWLPMKTMSSLIIMVANFNKRFLQTVEGVPQLERPTNLSIYALGIEGMAVQSIVHQWHSQAQWLGSLATQDPHCKVALAHYYALLIFLSRDFTFYPLWEPGTAPLLPQDTLENHATAIIELAEHITTTSDIPGVMLLFPLRQAGCYARDALQRDKILRVLSHIHQKGFVVSSRMKTDLGELWQWQGLD